MPFETRTAAQWLHIPQSTYEVMSHTQFDDIYATKKTSEILNPMVASYFILEKTEQEPAKSPPYSSEESGIVVKGTLELRDETGASVKLGEGSTFFIHRGSVITFEAADCDVCMLFTVAGRWSIHQ